MDRNCIFPLPPGLVLSEVCTVAKSFSEEKLPLSFHSALRPHKPYDLLGTGERGKGVGGSSTYE